MTEHFFTTTAGIKIPIQPISLLDLQLAQNAVEEQFKADDKPIEPPTYEVEVLGGEKEFHPHTKKTIEEATPEEKEAWQKHLEAVEEMQDEIQSRTALVFLEGIIFDLPEDNSWVKRRRKLFNEDVPEEPDEKKLHYINNVLLKTPYDKNNLMLEIQKLSMTGATPEAIEAFEDLFRRQMENAGREGLEELKAKLEEQEELVLQSAIERRDSSKIEGDDNSAIQTTANRRSSGNNSSRKHTLQDGGMGELSRPDRTREDKRQTSS